MEISNEMRVRIFAAYLDSRVLIPGNKISHLVGVSFINDQVETLLPGASIRKVYKVADCQLLLHNLKNIADEHVVEVARICDMKENFGKTLAEIGRDILGFHYQTSPLMMCSDGYALWIANIMPYHIVEAIDYLRSLSYHVPYMGIDLFEAGIAVEIKMEGGGDGAKE